MPTRPANRNERGQFAPGVSGNPSGRPKRDHDIADLAREYTQEALDTLVEILHDQKVNASARISAATAILDRGYGKAPQAVAVKPSHNDAFLKVWSALGSGAFDELG